MTPLGHVLSRLPLQPLLGRAMMLGTLVGVPHMTAALITVVSSDNLFNCSKEVRIEADRSRRDFCNWSDVIASVRALVEFENIVRERGEEAARAWCEHFFIVYERCVFLSKAKCQLMRDVQRSGLLGSADVEDIEDMTPDEWRKFHCSEERQEDQATTRTYQESAGAIFESCDGAALGRVDWFQELHTSSYDVEEERLLVGVLCSMFPSNLAYCEHASGRIHATGAVHKDVQMSMRSVNQNIVNRDSGFSSLGSTWWLYRDLHILNSHVSISGTTFLSPWHVALFTGARARSRNVSHLELDGWIEVRCSDPEAQVLVCNLRQEVKQALVWLSVANSHDKIACAAVARSKALLTVIGNVMLGQDPDERSVAFLKGMPKGFFGPQASEEDRGELERVLREKRKIDIQVLLREMGAKVSGNKEALVQRCADCLMDGEEQTGKAVMDFRQSLRSL
eukprot:TRINITY_DN1344_c0_g1_i1.p1 TRINITY_DN1344_c0_g1~~TRINITY_DN1344_c0_g1_i1.p1  ORF type:complete len:511 (-),score=78.88 TRINITY_DN1344_c0_g1_i1:854-2206(-)